MIKVRTRREPIRKPRDREVFHIGSQAWWSVEWRTKASPVWGIVALLVTCCAAFVMTWEGEVEPGVEAVVRAHPEEVVDIHAIYATGLVGRQTIHTVGLNSRGLLVTERMVLEPARSSDPERLATLMGDARSSRMVLRWGAPAIAALIVFSLLAARRGTRH